MNIAANVGAALSILAAASACQSANTQRRPSAGDPGNAGSALCDAGRSCSLHRTLDSGGKSRSYILHLPPDYERRSLPLVIYLHGTGNSAAYSESTTRLDELADRAGFALAYLDASQTNLSYPVWNIYFGDPIPGADDDVAAVHQLIVELKALIRPDPKRVYVAGFSVGAMMAQRVGVELANEVAAIASVEGTIKVDFHGVANVPKSAAPVSVLILHADRTDDMVPFCGGPNVQYGNWLFASQEETFNYWRGPLANRCATSSGEALCDGAGALGALTQKFATGCAGNSEVRLYRMLGGGHDWWQGPLNDPSHAPHNPAFDTGTGVTTNDVVWSFFAAHPKP